MHRIIEIHTADELAHLKGYAGLLSLDATVFKRHAPDVHLIVKQHHAIAAHCSLWWHHPPSVEHETPGLIGHYAAQDAESAALLLNHACEQLTRQGCTLAIAPMDGNTWRQYRLVSDRSSEPLFFLEPDNPDEWCKHFQQQGFEPLAEYRSALNTDLSQCDPRIDRATTRLSAAGMTVRPFNPEQFEQELQAIYQLSLVSFRQNFLYTPIDAAEFIAQYSQVRPYLDPRLVLMAEQAGQLVGFLFAIPDLLQAQRGELITTLIIKTVAVLPGKTYAGLGNVLVAQVQAIAHQLGYTRAIHALMHDTNQSCNLSARYAHPMRRYTLFSKPL